MKVLLDARALRTLRRFLPGHSIGTAQEMGWGGLKNGDLLGERNSDLSPAANELSDLRTIPIRARVD